MSFIGAKPTAVPLTASDLTDGIITSAKITDGTIATADISDGAVTSVKTTGVGGANTPAFLIYKSASDGSQNLTDGSYVQIVMTGEKFDTDNACASSTFTVPSGKAGKYYFTIGLRKNNFTSSRFNISLVNGSGADVVSIEQGTDSAYGTANGSTIVNLSAGNTLVMKVFHNQGGNQTTLQGIHQVYFGGYKIIE